MKKYLLLAIAAGFLAGCAQVPKVGPTPNAAPAMASNEQTRASIKQVRTHISEARAQIKKSEDSSAKGATHLEKADALTKQLLGEK